MTTVIEAEFIFPRASTPRSAPSCRYSGFLVLRGSYEGELDQHNAPLALHKLLVDALVKAIETKDIRKIQLLIYIFSSHWKESLDPPKQCSELAFARISASFAGVSPNRRELPSKLTELLSIESSKVSNEALLSFANAYLEKLGRQLQESIPHPQLSWHVSPTLHGFSFSEVGRVVADDSQHLQYPSILPHIMAAERALIAYLLLPQNSGDLQKGLAALLSGTWQIHRSNDNERLVVSHDLNLSQPGTLRALVYEILSRDVFAFCKRPANATIPGPSVASSVSSIAASASLCGSPLATTPRSRSDSSGSSNSLGSGHSTRSGASVGAESAGHGGTPRSVDSEQRPLSRLASDAESSILAPSARRALGF